MILQELNQKIPPPKKKGDDEVEQVKITSTLIGSPDKRNGSPSPLKNKYLPSRLGTAEVFNATTVTKRTALLHNLESNMNQIDHQLAKLKPEVIPNKIKEMKSNQPTLTVFKPNEFKKKPIKKADMDFQMYQEIFVAPKEDVLHQLKEKERAFEHLFHTGAIKQYDKVLTIAKEDNAPKYSFQGGSTARSRSAERKTQTKLNASQSHRALVRDSTELGKKTLNESKSGIKMTSPDREYLRNVTMPGGMVNDGKIGDADIADALAENGPTEENSKKIENERVFFDQQIQVQPPETPNFNPASPLTPGNGWAPSIPLVRMMDTSKSNIKDLLVRAKAGMQAGDVQKEAHLSFYLAMVHQTHNNYKQSIRFYKKFFACAQTMEDKIGMALALNRIGVNYFNDGKFDLSEKFHLKNLELSDRENSYAAFYNLGITCRSNDKLQEALNYFNESLEWAYEYNDVESECLSYGQIGVTYRDMRNYDEAIEFFKKCYNLSLKLRNSKLQLDCLLNMSKMIKAREEENPEESWNIYKSAYECAKELNDNKLANICVINMGVIGGVEEFDEFKNSMLIEFGDSTEKPIMEGEEDNLGEEDVADT